MVGGRKPWSVNQAIKRQAASADAYTVREKRLGRDVQMKEREGCLSDGGGVPLAPGCKLEKSASQQKSR